MFRNKEGSKGLLELSLVELVRHWNNRNERTGIISPISENGAYSAGKIKTVGDLTREVQCPLREAKSSLLEFPRLPGNP